MMKRLLGLPIRRIRVAKSIIQIKSSSILVEKSDKEFVLVLARGGGGLAPPTGMLGAPNQQAYSFEDSGLCA